MILNTRSNLLIKDNNSIYYTPKGFQLQGFLFPVSGIALSTTKCAPLSIAARVEFILYFCDFLPDTVCNEIEGNCQQHGANGADSKEQRNGIVRQSQLLEDNHGNPLQNI